MGQPTKRLDGCNKKQKQGKKGAGKVPKRTENRCERGQPTKRKVGCKILVNRTANKRHVWLQIKGQRGQRGVDKKRTKMEEKTG